MGRTPRESCKGEFLETHPYNFRLGGRGFNITIAI